MLERWWGIIVSYVHCSLYLLEQAKWSGKEIWASAFSLDAWQTMKIDTQKFLHSVDIVWKYESIPNSYIYKESGNCIDKHRE